MNKVLNAIIRSIELSDDIILDEDYEGFIVWQRGNTILFSEPQLIAGNVVEEVELTRSRFDFEMASCHWLAEHDDVDDCQIMFAVAQLFVITKNRGMLRHVIDWTNSSEIKCLWHVIEVKEGR